MTRWPTTPDPADPFPEPLPHRGDPAPFDLALASLWAGRGSEAEVAALATARGLDGLLAERTSPLPVASWLPTEADLVQIATGADPAAGNTGPDLVLGPVADGPVDRQSLVVAVALSAFFAGDGVRDAPFRRWLATRPPPDPAQAQGVRVLAQAPFAPWRIERIEGDRAWLLDVMGLSAPCLPAGPVQLPPPGLPLGAPGPGDLLAARVVPTAHGWVASCPLVVPGPLPGAASRWLRWIAWADRAERPQRQATRSGVLARRGHVLIRRLIEHAWASA